MKKFKHRCCCDWQCTGLKGKSNFQQWPKQRQRMEKKTTFEHSNQLSPTLGFCKTLALHLAEINMHDKIQKLKKRSKLTRVTWHNWKPLIVWITLEKEWEKHFSHSSCISNYGRSVCGVIYTVYDNTKFYCSTYIISTISKHAVLDELNIQV